MEAVTLNQNGLGRYISNNLELTSDIKVVFYIEETFAKDFCLVFTSLWNNIVSKGHGC